MASDPGTASPPDTKRSLLGNPWAYITTAALLLVLGAWPFLTDPSRSAPHRDPGYYTWRTEALMSEDPGTFLGIGPPEMYPAGYRVTTPILGALLRRVSDVSILRPTIFLGVAASVLIPLALASFVYSQRKNPISFHITALTGGALLQTAAFKGGLDGQLALLLITTTLPLIARVKDSRTARGAAVVLLLGSGLAHPPTFLIFLLSVGGMLILRFVVGLLSPPHKVAGDGLFLGCVLMAGGVLATVSLVGIWGARRGLAGILILPPPEDWVDQLGMTVSDTQPLVTLPLMVVGSIYLVSGRSWFHDDLAIVSIAWTVPLLGTLGFLVGLEYPFYRFINTALGWVLLAAVGLCAALSWARRRMTHLPLGRAAAAVTTTIVLGFLIAANGPANNAGGGWIGPADRQQFDSLRRGLAREDPIRPVVFVADIDGRSSSGVWAFLKHRVGDQGRFGLPHGFLDDSSVYLGSLENLVADEPTKPSKTMRYKVRRTYKEQSRVLLSDLRDNLDDNPNLPIVVVAAAFNRSGANVGLLAGQRLGALPPAYEVWLLSHLGIVKVNNGIQTFVTPLPRPSEPGLAHVVRVVMGLLALGIPGALLVLGIWPRAEVPYLLGFVPGLAIALLVSTGTLLIAVTRSPFDSDMAWATVIGATVIGAVGLIARLNTGHKRSRDVAPRRCGTNEMAAAPRTQGPER